MNIQILLIGKFVSFIRNSNLFLWKIDHSNYIWVPNKRMRKNSFNILAKTCAAVLLCASVIFANTDETNPAESVPADSSNASPSQADTSKADVMEVPSFRTFVDHSLTWAALLLTHKALKNSKELHTWPAFGFATPIAWNSSLRAEKDLGKLLTLKGLVGGNVSIMDFGINTDATLEVIHLLELGVSANIHSSINYGDYATFMGVYDTEMKDYDTDMFMTEFAYGIKYRVGATVPLIAFLPKSNWTKIILRPNANWTYTAYTGADDGEIWKAGSDNSANGYRYQYGGTLIYMLPFERVPMLMVNAGVGGFFKSTKFNEEYSDYDPYFKTVSIIPMLSLNISKSWSGMILTSISRDRKYENYRYETTEELLQKRVGAEWGVKVIMMTLTQKF